MCVHGVTVWDTVPSIWQNTIEILSKDIDGQTVVLQSANLRLIALTGEALHSDLPKAWRDCFAHPAKIVNLYSHSETVGTVSTYMVPDSFAQLQNHVSLGWPVDGSKLYVLDSNLCPMLAGEIGNIWVGGDRLADGYLDQPNLTQDRFVDDPFRAAPGARMYRTGDLGRLETNGAISFIGRSDHRVNIRGHRIEPADVEYALRQHPDVLQSVVTGRKDPNGKTRLVAYIVPSPAASPIVDGKLRYKLPNNLTIVHAHKHETDFTYRAIFEDQTHLKHGITLKDDDCIFDLGANIGQFSLFANLICARPRIYAFEPNPQAFAALIANMRLYQVDCRVFPYGLSNKEEKASFTAYDGFSLLSGLHSVVEEEKALARTFMANQQREGRSNTDGMNQEVEQLLEQHFASSTLEVTLRTLSQVIDEECIEHIDLIKINVEKSEWEVLQGIRQEHWPRIGQLVVKVDLTDRLEDIVTLLESHGLQCVIDQDTIMADSRIHTVYAVRPSEERWLIREQGVGEHLRQLPPLDDPLLSPRLLHDYMAGSLPSI